MQPWSGHAGRNVEPQPRQQRVKGLAEREFADRATLAEGKQRRLGVGTRAVSLLDVAYEALAHTRTKGHKPSLIELGIADQQRGVVEPDIAHQQSADLAHPQPQSIQ